MQEPSHGRINRYVRERCRTIRRRHGSVSDLSQRFHHAHRTDFSCQLRPAAQYIAIFQGRASSFLRPPITQQNVLARLYVAIDEVPAVCALRQGGAQLADRSQRGFLALGRWHKDGEGQYFGHGQDRRLRRVARGVWDDGAVSGLLSVTTCSRMKLVDPDAICVPATTLRTSPTAIRPRDRNACSAAASISSPLWTGACASGWTPHSRFMRLHTAGT